MRRQKDTWVVLTLVAAEPVDVRVFPDRAEARRFARTRRAQGWRCILTGAIAEPGVIGRGSGL